MIPLLVLTAAMAAPPQRTAAPQVTLQRYALVVGANFGGADRPKLQYAVTDAERFARVMTELGGVAVNNEIVLRQPKLREFLDGLEALSARVNAARKVSGSVRTEVVVYYSGHADEKGLLLGEDRVSYRSLRDKLDEIPADVRIAVLDACASGAFTRLKGGVARPPFTVDQSSAMRGHAFLTSSAETEAAQESDRIGASYFTHYLVSGFRGAADLSGDGRVTLSEAYQFAFTETLGRTVDTKGGAQHPSYDINLSGTGDVVMTDVRQTSARIVLADDIDGRFFVRTPARELVVELYKPAGRAIELGLEPGSYDIRVERSSGSFNTKARVMSGGRVVLDAKQFAAAPLETTRMRGGANRYEAPQFAMNGRQRLSIDAGAWNKRDIAWTATEGIGGLSYAISMRENLAFVVGLSAFSRDFVPGVEGASGFAIPIGVEWNPLPGRWAERRFKPWIAIGVIPVFATSVTPISSRASYVTGSDGSVGAYSGAGIDVHASRWFSLGARTQYNAVSKWGLARDGRLTYGGAFLALRVGVVFGKSR